METSVFSENNVHPDQTLRPAASDRGLHSLPVSLLLDHRHKLVKTYISAVFENIFKNWKTKLWQSA